MNKKIWIGLVSVFLILLLVLGIQMLNGEAKPGINQDQEQSSEPSPDEGGGEQTVIDVNTDNQQIPTKADDQPEAESPEEADQSTVFEDPVEPPTETSKPVEETKPTQDDPTPTETPGPLGKKEPSPFSQSVTLSVSVKTLLDKKDTMNPEKWELVPEDGWIFPAQEVEFYEGESAFNVLLREMKKNKIHMEYVMTPIYNSNYIEGIGNLYEFDCGELSGWMYSVNDSSPSLGTSNYILKDGDVVRLIYTCDLGRDIGFGFNE